jgi:hypothetical protein
MCVANEISLRGLPEALPASIAESVCGCNVSAECVCPESSRVRREENQSESIIQLREKPLFEPPRLVSHVVQSLVPSRNPFPPPRSHTLQPSHPPEPPNHPHHRTQLRAANKYAYMLWKHCLLLSTYLGRLYVHSTYLAA